MAFVEKTKRTEPASARVMTKLNAPYSGRSGSQREENYPESTLHTLSTRFYWLTGGKKFRLLSLHRCLQYACKSYAAYLVACSLVSSYKISKSEQEWHDTKKHKRQGPDVDTNQGNGRVLRNYGWVTVPTPGTRERTDRQSCPGIYLLTWRGRHKTGSPFLSLLLSHSLSFCKPTHFCYGQRILPLHNLYLWQLLATKFC